MRIRPPDSIYKKNLQFKEYGLFTALNHWRPPRSPTWGERGFFNPVRTAFPVTVAGRRPHLYFRGLLKLHTRYGLHSCSPTIRGLYREAPPWPIPRIGRSQATKFNQQPPWVGPSPTGDLRR